LALAISQQGVGILFALYACRSDDNSSECTLADLIFVMAAVAKMLSPAQEIAMTSKSCHARKARAESDSCG
jgi:hypothetical protein